MANMSDDQLKMYIDQLRANKEMAKMAFAQRPGAPPMSDAQLDMMLNMMTPEMMRMSFKMAEENPDLLRQSMGAAHQQQQQAT